jgi:hypothetical protein
MGNVQTKHVTDKAGPPPKAASPNNYLTASAIAKILGVTPQTVNNWRRADLIPASLDLQDTVRYDPEDVRAALTALTREKQRTRGARGPDVAAPEKPGDQHRTSDGNQRVQSLDTPFDERVLAALRTCLPGYLAAIANELNKTDPPSSGFWTAGIIGSD